MIGSVLKTHVSEPLGEIRLGIACEVDNLPAGLLCCPEMGDGIKDKALTVSSDEKDTSVA